MYDVNPHNSSMPCAVTQYFFHAIDILFLQKAAHHRCKNIHLVIFIGLF